MNIESAAYTQDGIIEAVIDGVTVFVPDDTSNRYRRKIAEWEMRGNAVAVWTEPPVSTDATYSPLAPWQFFMLIGPDQLDIEDDIEAQIEAMTDTTQRAMARALYGHSTVYNREIMDIEPFASIKTALVEVGKLDADSFDDLWMTAANWQRVTAD